MKRPGWFFNKKSMSEEQKNTSAEEQTIQQKTEANAGHELPGEPQNETEKKIAALEEQLAQANDKYLRLYSEFDNFRRRTAKERVDLMNMAGAEIIKSLLPVIDDFERALKNNEKATDVAAVNEGVNLIAQKFRSMLGKNGLEPMNSMGQPFDVDMHEAITNIPAPSEDMKGKVIDEVEKGYLLNGKVIRFAKVVVGA